MAKGKKTSYKNIANFVEKKDGVLLNVFSTKGVRFITIKCNKDNNIWDARLASVYRNGQWCKECYKQSKIKKITPQEVDQIIEDKGFILLSSNKVNLWGDVKVRCIKHNIEWVTRPAYLKSGHSNCKLCGHGTMDLDELKKIVESNNAVFVKRIKSAKHTNRNIVLRCLRHNHEWTTNANDIRKLDRWCYHCSWEDRKTSYKKIEDMVIKNGGTLITKNCTGSTTKINVKCGNNHEWQTTYDYINGGNWCPKCLHKNQTKLYTIIQELFPGLIVEYNYRKFEWLKSKNKLEIDIWVPYIKLAIEYDGIHHFKPIKFSSKITDEDAEKAFKATQYRDTRKNNLIASHPEEIQHFVRFSYKDVIDKTNIIKILKLNAVEIEV